MRTPDVDADSEQFWSHLQDGQLWLPECDENRHRFFPPMSMCPICRSPVSNGGVVSGQGTLYSWVTVDVALSPDFINDVPYVVVAVDLVEGGRMFGRYWGSADSLSVSAAVRFKPYAENGHQLPGFILELLA